ncbi:hypothetical protein [Sphingobacterium sp. UBA1498]|uniref:hypothetical protein n=1 Tax=Sphingobacterium sp. UBA1498 TaxID=1947481 RepID=UPI0025FD57E3|nr:hypothetical protein [Sphingobacterium sp. UBA1498]
MVNKKSIILIIPLHFQFYRELISSLQNVGFEVIFLFITDKPFKYTNFVERARSFIHKNLLLQHNFKKQLIFGRENKNLLTQLEKIERKIDYALIIRSDLLGIATLRTIKSKVNKMVAYQWDGLNRFPSVFDRIDLFDKFFVFDDNDYLKYKDSYTNICFTTNFYLEIPPDKDVVVKPQSLCFVGSYLENRMPFITELIEFLIQENFDVNVKLLCTKDKTIDKYKDSGIEFISDPLTYTEMLRHVQHYEALLDFDNAAIHYGLSFRIFEALFYRKKIITNNLLIKNYDFYHPNNVFVWDGSNLLKLRDFLNKPFVEIDNSIIEKYSFRNWVKKVLD